MQRAFTLIELIVGMSIMLVVAGFLGQWFFLQKNYQQRISKIGEIQDNFRKASWNMIQELQTGRTIIWPRINSDKSIRTDSKIVFKDFQSRIVSFYHVPAAKEIRRCVIPNGPGTVEVDDVPVAGGIASVTFTASDIENRLISFHLSTEGVHALDAVFLMNTD